MCAGKLIAQGKSVGSTWEMCVVREDKAQTGRNVAGKLDIWVPNDESLRELDIEI